MTRLPRFGLPCPDCGSRATKIVTRRKQGCRIIGDSALRGHECHDCGRLFLSIQRVATAEDIERAEGAA